CLESLECAVFYTTAKPFLSNSMCGYLIRNRVIFVFQIPLKRNAEFLHYANNVGSQARLGPRQAGAACLSLEVPTVPRRLGSRKAGSGGRQGRVGRTLGRELNGCSENRSRIFNELFTYPSPLPARSPPQSRK